MTQPTWPLRYLRGSRDTNMYMSGLGDIVDWTGTDMTPRKIRQLIDWFAAHAVPCAHSMTLWRGVAHKLPYIGDESLDASVPKWFVNKHYMSTSTSRAIGKEFQFRKGWLHRFDVRPGVMIYPMSDVDTEKLRTRTRLTLAREREVIIMPGMLFVYVKTDNRNRTIYWTVVNPDTYSAAGAEA